VKKTLDFFRILVFESGCFAAVHYSSSDSLGIIDFFEEETMFPNPRNAYTKELLACHYYRNRYEHTKSCILGTDSDN
jgi:hypothetical protein